VSISAEVLMVTGCRSDSDFDEAPKGIPSSFLYMLSGHGQQ
jgi:hypothetical protein